MKRKLIKGVFPPRRGGHRAWKPGVRVLAALLAALLGLSLGAPALALPPVRDDPIDYTDPEPVNPDNPDNPDNPGNPDNPDNPG